MQELYRNASDTPESSFSFDQRALAASLKRIYGREFDPKDEIDKGLFSAIRESIDQGTEIGFNAVVPDRDRDFLQALKSNNAVFSAFKTHRMQNDIAGQLLDGDGRLKSFAQFKADTAGMVDHQVNRWLRTEYNTAVLRAHQAADWQQFLREKDVLPNLRWNKSTSVEPRASHRQFWGRIWSIDDPFWQHHKPGDAWGCKCSLSNTDDPVTDNSDLDLGIDPPAPGLGGNPGVTAKIFSDDHPYVKNAYKGAKKAVKNLLEELQAEQEEVSERKFKSGGVLQLPKGFHQNAMEEKKNIRGYTELAKMHGERYKLLSVVDEHGHKNPDALNLRTGRLSDMKAPETDNGKNAIQAAIKAASRQKVGEVYIYLDRDYPLKDIYAGLRAALYGKRAAGIKEIIIRRHDGELKRYDADKLRQWIKN